MFASTTGITCRKIIIVILSSYRKSKSAKGEDLIHQLLLLILSRRRTKNKIYLAMLQ